MRWIGKEGNSSGPELAMDAIYRDADLAARAERSPRNLPGSMRPVEPPADRRHSSFHPALAREGTDLHGRLRRLRLTWPLENLLRRTDQQKYNHLQAGRTHGGRHTPPLSPSPLIIYSHPRYAPVLTLLERNHHRTTTLRTGRQAHAWHRACPCAGSVRGRPGGRERVIRRRRQQNTWLGRTIAPGHANAHAVFAGRAGGWLGRALAAPHGVGELAQGDRAGCGAEVPRPYLRVDEDICAEGEIR